MIGSLRGTLEEFEPSEGAAVDLVVVTGGVGYAVTICARHAASLGTLGSEVHLAVHTHVREGDITLFGFASPLERRVFEILLGAHGVGPSIALALVSAYPPAQLAEVLGTGDVAALQAVQGVGVKTAQRLIVDLGERLAGLAHSPIEASAPVDAGARSAVREALVALGYGADEVRAALGGLEPPEDPADTGALLRAALQHLATGR